MTQFSGRVALVTGGAKGIGLIQADITHEGAPQRLIEAVHDQLDDMKSLGGGAIVSISSTSATRPDPTMIAYGASKAALNALTASAALAFVSDGIRVNALAPGFTRTPRVDTVDPKAQAAMLARVPMARLADPEEIAAAVAFLLSDEASYITGQVLTAAGGP